MQQETALLRLDPATRWPRLPLLAVVAAITSWGFGSVLVKLTTIDGNAISFYRLWLGVLMMLVVLAASRTRLSMRGIRRAAPAGILFGVNVAMWFSAVKLTTIANATIITSLQPALVLVLAGPLFGELVGKREVAWTAVSLCGVAMVVAGATGNNAWSPAGDALAFGALFTFTGYFLLSKHIRAELSTVEYMVVVQIFAALVVTPIGLTSPGELVSVGARDWLLLGIFVVITGVGAHLLVNWAHAYVDVSLSSMLTLLVPVIAAFVAWAVLDERLTLLQIVGGAITLVAIVAIVRRPADAAELPHPSLAADAAAPNP